MFGFSIGKLLVLAIILVVVLYGFKLMSRAGAPQRSTEDEPAEPSRVDTVYDPETDSYVVKGSRKETKKNK